MPPTIHAQRDHGHFPTRHFPAHFPTAHFVLNSEVLWSTAPKSCMAGVFNIIADGQEGIFDVTINQQGYWSEC